jgi:hypothetical protein
MMKKRGFLVLALVMSVAGVASAFAPLPKDSSARPPARELALPVAAKQPDPTPVAPAPEPVVKKASFEIKQAPVPLIMRARPTIETPVFDADAVGPEVPVLAKSADAPADNSAAKAAIEADGYRNAKVVRQGENGIWYAKAMRGTTEVSLTVDATGRVSLE